MDSFCKMKIHFQDEAPRIGNGWRLVTVEIGRKWVTVRDLYSSRRKARFTLKQWEDVSKHGVVIDDTPGLL